jgi:SnoaL-like domain
MRLSLLSVAVLALAACTPDSAKVDAEIEQFARSYLTSNDINTSLSMLDSAPTTTSITSQGRIARGPVAIKDEPNKQITRLPQLKVTVGKIEVTRLGTAHALVVAPFGVGPSATPDKPTSEGGATLLLAKRDSGWKVIHEHFSYAAARK